MADRREYAARYDAMAQKLYQIAVYLTGDALEARRAIAACFVSGYDAAARGEAPFEETMLRELCRWLRGLSGGLRRAIPPSACRYPCAGASGRKALRTSLRPGALETCGNTAGFFRRGGG